MRLALSTLLGFWVALGLSCGGVRADPAAQTPPMEPSHAPESQSAPGLAEEVFKPFAEATAFPLQTLIDYRATSTLITYRGRCQSLDLFGRTLTSLCEGRAAITVTGPLTTIQWFFAGPEAIGLETVAPLDPPVDGVIRYNVGKVHLLSGGKATTEAAMGACRVDAFYRRCQTIGRSGRIDAAFATLGGTATRQYPAEDSIFRIPRSEVFIARGRCVGLFKPEDATPYCASFVGKAVLDKKALLIFFTGDARTVIGFYGLLENGSTAADGSFVLSISRILRLQGDSKAGTAPVEGTCRLKEQAGGMSVSCGAKTDREHATFEASFQANEPWKDAVRFPPD